MRVYNFSAGPAALPLPVLEQARDEMLDWQGGMSVMEISHRSKPFMAVAERAEADLRELLAVPAELSRALHAGRRDRAVRRRAAELRPAGATADYVNTGHWSGEAIREAASASVPIAATRRPRNTRPCRGRGTRAAPGAAYLHYTPNETIGGVEFPYIPDTGRVPLVADMSSSILSRPIDVSRFGAHLRGRAEEHRPAGSRGRDRAR